jgi:Beta-lactamase enzyme family
LKAAWACLLVVMATAGGLASSSAQAARLRHRHAASGGLSTRVFPARVKRGGSVTISGSLTSGSRPLVGELLELQLQRGGEGAFVNVAHTLTALDGRYRFAHVRIYGNTRLRVADVGRGMRTGPAVAVVVALPAFPASSHVLAAAHWLSARAGRTAFAVIDDRGRLAGVNVHLRFHSASVVKSMLLVAYLQMLAQRHRFLDSESQHLLYPMIHSSDNEAASAVLSIVGEQALDRVAQQAGMSDYEPGGGTWGFTEISASDLARFFSRQDAMIPARFDGYARWLLSGIEASESWGIPAVARPAFRVFFKGGWLPEVEGLVNQAARLERPGEVFSLAVLTTHDPSMAYGEQTIQGVTAQLLGYG